MEMPYTRDEPIYLPPLVTRCLAISSHVESSKYAVVNGRAGPEPTFQRSTADLLITVSVL